MALELAFINIQESGNCDYFSKNHKMRLIPQTTVEFKPKSSGWEITPEYRFFLNVKQNPAYGMDGYFMVYTVNAQLF